MCLPIGSDLQCDGPGVSVESKPDQSHTYDVVIENTRHSSASGESDASGGKAELKDDQHIYDNNISGGQQ